MPTDSTKSYPTEHAPALQLKKPKGPNIPRRLLVRETKLQSPLPFLPPSLPQI